MKSIKNFNQFINDTGFGYDYVITLEDAKKLYSLEEDNLAPGESVDDNDYDEFINDVVGKTLKEYSEWRYPDDPDQQFQSAISILCYHNLRKKMGTDVQNIIRRNFHQKR